MLCADGVFRLADLPVATASGSSTTPPATEKKRKHDGEECKTGNTEEKGGDKKCKAEGKHAEEVEDEEEDGENPAGRGRGDEE